MAAKRGHAQVFSQSLLHAGWHSESEVPRKGMHVSWVAEGVSIGGMAFNDNAGRIDGVRERSRALRERLPADRRRPTAANRPPNMPKGPDGITTPTGLRCGSLEVASRVA